MNDCLQTPYRALENYLSDQLEILRIRAEIASTQRKIEAAEIVCSVEQSLTIIYQNCLHPKEVPTRAYSALAARSSDIEA